jgi:hypothetical protein
VICSLVNPIRRPLERRMMVIGDDTQECDARGTREIRFEQLSVSDLKDLISLDFEILSTCDNWIRPGPASLAPAMRRALMRGLAGGQSFTLMFEPFISCDPGVDDHASKRPMSSPLGKLCSA